MGSEHTVWVAVDIGCIECGESTDLIGLYATRDEANAACAECAGMGVQNDDPYYGFFTGGQHRAEFFEGQLPR